MSKRNFSAAALLLIVTSSCSVDSPEKQRQSYLPCGDFACGDSWTLCAPGDGGCNETSVEKHCHPDSSGSSGKPTCYDPCKGKACGESCTICAPGDDSCEETVEKKYCQAFGSCSAAKPACDMTCNSRVTASEFEACIAAEDAETCAELGGQWEDGCVCPTGEGNCPCKSADDCLGSCLGYFNACEQSTEGSCAEKGPRGLGCDCVFANGIPQEICAD